jgi:hypothetical protein
MFSSFAHLRRLPEIRQFAFAIITVAVSVACSGDYGTGTPNRVVVTVSSPSILINEVNPNGDLPAGGWVELFNPTARAVDLVGWTITSGDVLRSFTFPAGLFIESGGYVAVNEQTLPAALNATDAVHVFNKFGVQSDSYSWTSNAPGMSYGRCPDGIGPLVTTLAPTRKAVNACP